MKTAFETLYYLPSPVQGTEINEGRIPLIEAFSPQRRPAGP
jgi:hypothetical protein